MSESLRFKRLHELARLPARGSRRAAGLDLYSIEQLTIEPGGRALVRTGLSVEIPEGFYGRVAPRSGLAIEQGLDVLAGVIDGDYRGELKCALINLGREPVTLEVGQRMAQLIIEAIAAPQPVWADELKETARGPRGFGSSGNAAMRDQE